jgi:predicted aspartyl protease
MGHVYTTLKLINHRDAIPAEEQMKKPEEVRTLTLDNVLADSGTSHFCLPEEVIKQLGLKLKREVTVQTATGFSTRLIYGDVTIEIADREATVDCVALPTGVQPLLGVIPMESMGINLDLNKHELVFVPLSDTSSYILV